ncbi:MAG: hypothetical protein AAGF12_17680 [Myxococcota bacterium]
MARRNAWWLAGCVWWGAFAAPVAGQDPGESNTAEQDRDPASDDAAEPAPAELVNHAPEETEPTEPVNINAEPVRNEPVDPEPGGSEPPAQEGVESPGDDAEEGPWRNEFLRFDLGGILNLYTAAVEVGTDGESNQRLVNDVSFGLHAAATWRFWGPFSVGLYAQFETGSREYGRFDEVGPDGVAMVEREGGGSFTEFWFGPLLRAQWEALFLEFGWGPLGIRSDNGRDDLPADGRTDGSFRTTPSIAWLIGIGAAVELFSDLELVMRLNYRIRYYEVRGGEDLDQGLAHGTQDFIPFVGLAWAFDRTIL